jgi:hypothetical protein
MKRGSWLTVLGAGVLWTLVYYLVWGVAWFLFMRQEWADAFARIGRPLAWTKEVWGLWIIFALPIGIAVTAYARERPFRALKASVHAALTAWIPLTAGTAVWCRLVSLEPRIIALDSSVNLVAMLTGSLVIGWRVLRVQSGNAAP